MGRFFIHQNEVKIFKGIYITCEHFYITFVTNVFLDALADKTRRENVVLTNCFFFNSLCVIKTRNSKCHHSQNLSQQTQKNNISISILNPVPWLGYNGYVLVIMVVKPSTQAVYCLLASFPTEPSLSWTLLMVQKQYSLHYIKFTLRTPIEKKSYILSTVKNNCYLFFISIQSNISNHCHEDYYVKVIKMHNTPSQHWLIT